MIDQNKEISRVTYNGADIPIKSEGGEEIEWEYFVKGENFNQGVFELFIIPCLTLGKVKDFEFGLYESFLGVVAFFEFVSNVNALGVRVSKSIQDYNLMGVYNFPKGTSITEAAETLGASLDGVLTQITKEEYDALGVE